MIFVPQQEVNILDSNVAEVEVGIDVYSHATTYNTYDLVQHNGEVFESLADTNLDNTPVPSSLSLFWNYKRKVNYYKLLDDKMNTSTQNADTITYTFLVSDVDTVCFFGLAATNIKIELYTLQDLLLYEKEIETYNRTVSDWSRWTVAKSSYKTIAFFKDIPYVYEAKLKITIRNIGNIAKCAHIVYGESVDMGITLVGTKPTSSIQNIISKEKDEYGNIITANSMTYKQVTASVLLDTNSVSEVQNLLEKYTVTPLLFVADEREGGIDSLICFGYYKDFDMPIGISKTEYSLEIEGII